MEFKVWQSQNRAAIAKRLDWLNEQSQGTLFFEPSGVHFISVEKIESQLRLALLEQVNLMSNLAQSRLDLKDPLYLVAPYSQAALLGLVWKSEPKRIYLAGFGGGRIPMVLHHYFPKAIIECTDIDPNIIEAATKFFGVELDARLQVTLQDGREYLDQCQPDIQYDIIFTDVVLCNGYAPYRMATKEFYALCQKHLSEGGVVVVNLLQTDAFYTEKVKTIQSAFARVCICPVQGGNTIIFGTNSDPIERSEIILRAQCLQDTHQFSFPLVERSFEVKMGAELKEDLPNLETAQILTDACPPPAYFQQLPSFKTFFAQVGNNDPCPCGSGQPFQHCHG